MELRGTITVVRANNYRLKKLAVFYILEPFIMKTAILIKN